MSSLPTTEFPPVLSADDLPITALSRAVAAQSAATYGSLDYGTDVVNTTARTTTYSIPIPSTTFRAGTAIRITGVWFATCSAPTGIQVALRIGPSNNSTIYASVGYTVVDDPIGYMEVTVRLRPNPPVAGTKYNAVTVGTTYEQENQLQPWATTQGYTPDADDAVWMTIQWVAADPTNSAYGTALTVEVLQPTALT